MSDVKVGDKIEVLSTLGFNKGFVNVCDVAKVIGIDSKYISFVKDGWDLVQHSKLNREGESWRILPPTIEPPTINPEPFITIKGVEVGSSLERALNLIVAVYNGDSVRCNEYGYTSIVRHCEAAIGAVVRVIEDKGFDWCFLKSEEEAKLNKEALDKEIKELEGKLQALKTKRGG